MSDCKYCEKNEELYKVVYTIAELPESILYLFREQSHPGRVIVAHREHVEELAEMPAERRNAFMDDVARAARAVQKAFSPDKINYGLYGDMAKHLHIHIVPKYKGRTGWGGAFELAPSQNVFSDEQCEAVAEKIRQAL